MEKITIIAHPPERASHKGPPLLCAGCGCCCCCCLHTLGGVVGTLIAGRQSHAAGEQSGALAGSGTVASAAAMPPASQSVTGLYWKTLGVLSLIALVAGFGGFGLVILLFCLPILQLLAAGIVAIMIRKQPAAAQQQLGRLTGLGLLGAIAGVLFMIWIAR